MLKLLAVCSESPSVMSDSLRPQGLYNPWNSPARILEVGSLCFLQAIFPTQGWNPGLPHCRRILYQLSHEGSPRTPEWVAFPFSRGSLQPRNWTGVSCIAGRFFTNWAMREALKRAWDLRRNKGQRQMIVSMWKSFMETKKNIYLESRIIGHWCNLIYQSWIRDAKLNHPSYKILNIIYTVRD